MPTSMTALVLALACLLPHSIVNAATDIIGYTSLTDPTVVKLLKGNSAVLTLPADTAYTKGIASSFVGLSMDLDNAMVLGSAPYQSLLQDLHAFGTGPLRIRIGGYLLDRATGVIASQYWNALASAAKACPITYQVDANMWAESATITRKQVVNIQQNAPKGALATIGVGNEPDMYNLPCDGPCTYKPKANSWLGTVFVALSKTLFPAASGGAKGILSGPNWSTLKMDPTFLDYWLQGVSQYLDLVTVHHYVSGTTAKDTQAVTVPQLLDDATQGPRISNLQKLVGVAYKYNKLPLRITECASISYGGNDGVSNVLAAALWSIDTLFEVAAAGAVGIDFHQVVTSQGGANYNALEYKPGDYTQVRIKPPFYGLLFWQKATRGTQAGYGTVTMAPQPAGSKFCKAWFVRIPEDGSLRITVINKANNQACLVQVKLTVAQLSQYRPQATVDFLYGEQSLYERQRIYFSGLTYAYWGPGKVGQIVPKTVTRYVTKSGGKVNGGGFLVEMAPGTQAITLTIAKA